MRERLNMRLVDGLRPVVNAKTAKWRRTAKRAWYEIHRNSQNLGTDEWFLLAVLVMCGMAIVYATLLTTALGQTLW